MSALDAPGADTAGGPRRFGWWVAGIVVVFVAVMLATVVVVTRQPPWDPVVGDYVELVESERGLEFKRPVAVRWADIAHELSIEFAAERLDRGQAKKGASTSLDPFGEAYRLLGLISPGEDVDFSNSIDQTTVENAGAFYEPWTETIVLPLGTDLDALGFTIVHELTHALQHQHGMLNGYDESQDSESMRLALIEGDAERIAMAWYDQLTSVERDRYLAASGDDPDAEWEDPGDAFLETSFHLSYSIGLPVAKALVEGRGVAALNRRLRSEHIGSSEQLIDILGSSERSRFDATLLIDPDRVRTADGDLGALTWFRALAPVIGTDLTLDAIVGYDDDAFVIAEATGCGTFALTFDAPREAEQFASIMSLLGKGPTIAQDSSVVRLEICDPIGSPLDQRFGTIVPIIVLNELTVIHLRNGASDEEARCAAQAQAATIPADQPVSAFIGWDALDADAPEYLQAC